MLKQLAPEQIAREARRVLPHLARGERVLAAAEGGGYGLFDSRSFRPRTELRLSGALVEAFARAELIELRAKTDKDPRPTRYVLTSVGRAYLARTLSSDEPFADQHRILARGESAFAPRLVSSNGSPVAWLKTRKGPDGEPFLSDAEVAAGERLHADFSAALTSASVRSAWPQPRVDMSRRVDFSPTPTSQAAEVARSRFWHAVEAVGPELAPVLVAAACQLKPLESVEAALGLPARSAKSLLKAGLKALARYYGLAPAAKTRAEVRAAAAGPLPAG